MRKEIGDDIESEYTSVLPHKIGVDGSGWQSAQKR